MFLRKGSVTKGISNVAHRVPFIQCLVYFPWETHKQALKKFAILWVLTSLPIFFAVMYANETTTPLASSLLDKLNETISPTEQFVYSASFLSPILYIFFEKCHMLEKGQRTSQIPFEIKLFRGYGWVVLTCLLILMITASSFGNLKSSPDSFKLTRMNQLLVDGAFYVYAFSLYCWYLSFLDGSYDGNYDATVRNTEKQVEASFDQRIKSRE